MKLKLASLVALFISTLAITTEARPIQNGNTLSITKKELGNSFTWRQQLKIHKDRAFIKFSTNIKAAYANGLVSKDAIDRMNQAFNERGASFAAAANSNVAGSNLQINDEADDVGYFGPVTIGGQQFNTIFDTGSSDCWVPAKNCTAPACTNHKPFDEQASKTFQSRNLPFNVTYGTGQVSGLSAFDTITLAGVTGKKIGFGLTTNESDQFINPPFDGILGMAFDQLNEQKTPTVFSAFISNKAVKSPEFAFKLGRLADQTPSQLTIGGIDQTQFKGALTLAAVIDNVGFWNVAIDDATVNGKALGFKNRAGIMDTGTTLLIVPQADAVTIHNGIPGATQVANEFVVPCNTTAQVALTISGTSFKINPKDIARQPIGQNNLCASGIAAGNIGGANQWLVGDTFLKNTYTVFNQGTKNVGFAQV